MTFASQIERTTTPCSEILNSGSVIYVSNLVDCNTTPIEATIEADANITIVDTTATISLNSSTYSPQNLAAGAVIYFPAANASITLSEDVTLTDIAQVVNIDAPPSFQIDLGDTANFYIDIFKLISPTDIPFNFTADVRNRVDLSTVQGGALKGQITLDMNVTCIANLTDNALWDVIFDSAKSLNFVYASVFDTSKKAIFGKTLIENYAENGQVDEIKRPNFNFKFLNADYQVFKPFDFLEVADQTAVNDERSKLLLPRY